MRRCDEPVEVRKGMVAGREGPAEFEWRGRRWLVHQLQESWVQTVDWWDAPEVRAARGEQLEDGDDAGGDLLVEEEVWRVEASWARRGQRGEPGVYELAHRWSDGRWRLRAVLD